MIALESSSLRWIQPPLDNNPWPCFPEDDWMKLLYPLNFPGFSIGEGPDNMQTGDTLLFNIIEDTPMAGSGTLECWERALQEGSFFDECVVLTVFQINDSAVSTVRAKG